VTVRWRFVCDVCGKVGHGRTKGWYEVIDIPPFVSPDGEVNGEAQRFQSAELHRRGSGGRFICRPCMEQKHGLELAALIMLQAPFLDRGVPVEDANPETPADAR
jgi:hypothetical protein